MRHTATAPTKHVLSLSEHSPVIVAAIIGFLASGYAYRWEIYLGFDQFFYVDSVRAILRGNVTGIHTTWAPGYPLIGAIISLVGLRPADALVLASMLSVGLTLHFLNRLLISLSLPIQLRTAVLTAYSLIPARHLLVATPLSESLFTLTVTFLLVGMNRYHQTRNAGRLGIAIAMAFMVRYVGIVFLPLPLVLMVSKRLNGIHARRMMVQTAIAFLVVCTVLVWNHVFSGDITGASRITMRGDVVEHFSALGWAFVALVSTEGLQIFSAGFRNATGFVVLFCILALCVHTIIKGMDEYVRNAAIAAVLYFGGFVALASIASDMPLYHPRFVAPLLPALIVVSLAFIMYTMDSMRARRLIWMLSMVCIVVGVVQVGRVYASRDPMSLTRSIEAAIGDAVSQDDILLVNSAVKSLYRSAEGTVIFTDQMDVWAKHVSSADWIVIAGTYTGNGYFMNRSTRDMRILVEGNPCFELYQTGDGYVVFRRSKP